MDESLNEDRLSYFLVQTYRRDVLGESLEVEMPEVDLAEVERRIAAIDALKLGVHLANRDFVSYQNRRALVALRNKLKAVQKQEEIPLGPNEYGPRGMSREEIEAQRGAANGRDQA
jgi:hypothetical protein